jgi:hypothetical protein
VGPRSGFDDLDRCAARPLGVLPQDLGVPRIGLDGDDLPRASDALGHQQRDVADVAADVHRRHAGLQHRSELLAELGLPRSARPDDRRDDLVVGVHEQGSDVGVELFENRQM